MRPGADSDQVGPARSAGAALLATLDFSWMRRSPRFCRWRFSEIQILPVIVILGGMIVVNPGTSRGDEHDIPISQEALREIRSHLIKVFGATSAQDASKVRKWNGPVRYYYGKFHRPEHRAFVESTMDYFGELAGLSVEKADKPTDAVDLFLLFTSDFPAQMQARFLQKVFRNHSESDEAYEARMANIEPRGGAITTTGFNGDMVQYHVVVVNAAGIDNDGHLRGLVMRELFAAFTFCHARSDVILPSVSNRGVLPDAERLPLFDEAFLRALYSADIRHGMPLSEVLPIIAAQIYDDLR